MSKSESTFAALRRLVAHKPARTSFHKPRWNAFGLRREERDPAALAFARLGLLATRW